MHVILFIYGRNCSTSSILIYYYVWMNDEQFQFIAVISIFPFAKTNENKKYTHPQTQIKTKTKYFPSINYLFS